MSKPPGTKTSVTSESFDPNQYQSNASPPALDKGSRGRLRPSVSRFASWVRRAIFGMLPFLARAPRLALFSIASILLGLVAVHELRTKAVSWRGSQSYIAHWQTPRQLYDERTLPAFENAIIESVEPVPGSDRIWIAGDGALLAFSDDRGHSWTTFHYDAASGTMAEDMPVKEVALQVPLLRWRVEAAHSQAQQRQLPPNANSNAPSPATKIASIYGKVTDSSGKTIPMADVQIVNVDTKLNRSTKTVTDGSYAFPDLPFGTYDLRVTRAGFLALDQRGIAVNGDTLLNLVLRVNAVSDSTVQTTVPPQAQRPEPAIASKLPAQPRRSQTTIESKPQVPQPPADPPNWIAIEFNTTKSARLSAATGYTLYSLDAGQSWVANPSSPYSDSQDKARSRHGSVKFSQRGTPLTTFFAEKTVGFTLYTEPRVSVVAPMDRALRINTPGNSAPVKIVADVNAHIYGITGKEPNDIWVVGNSTTDGAAEIYHSADRGVSWSRQFYRFGFGLLDIAFQSDGRTGFASGSEGAILRTLDAGQSWEPATLGAAAPGKSSTDYQWWQQPWRIPAPLSLLEMFLALFFLIPVLVPEVAPVPIKQTIASVTVSDAPIVSPTDDTLGFGPVARAISGLLRNKGTKLPLTLAITAKWGRGKTSLMSLVQQDLKHAGWRTVWFNAWHHQEELSLLAALLQTVRQKAPPTLLERNGVRYRLKLLAARLMRWQTLWVAAACLVLYNSETAVHVRHPHMYGCAAQYLYTTSGGDLKPDESLCDKAAPALSKLIATTGTNQQKSANAKTVAGKAGVTTQQKPLETTANAPLTPSPNPPREKPGVLQFLMRLIFDAALKLEVLEQSNRPGVHIIPLFVLVTLVTILGWQILQSFGANPAEFLTTETARHNVSEIEARSSFLEKFRKQYGDVVGALGKYRLAIFVDDLDRCRPDKISEMLEATNYLMAAGPCAMVMALEEQAVIAGLGLSFSRMAEEFVQLPQSTGPSRDLLAEAYAKRQAFGKQYVEKLLNIVVQVPAMDAAKFGRVLAGSGRTPEIDAERSKRRFRKFAELARVPAAAIVLATIILVGGSLLSGWLLGRNPQKVIVPNSAAEQAGAVSTGNSVQPPAIGPPSVPAAQVSNTIPHPSYVAAISPIPHRWFTGWRQSVAWFFILVAVAATTLARRPPPTTTDSAQFLQALKLWAPVLADVNPSPRAAKRLLNRLRYLAMLERESAKEPEAETGTIPEPMLVALGILQVATPVTLESASAFQSLRATVETAGRGLVDTTLELARQAMRDHAQQFGRLTDGQLNEYRVRFLDLSAGITAR